MRSSNRHFGINVFRRQDSYMPISFEENQNYVFVRKIPIRNYLLLPSSIMMPKLPHLKSATITTQYLVAKDSDSVLRFLISLTRLNT